MIWFAIPLAIAAVALILFDLRHRAAVRHHREMLHIESSATFLHAHARALEQFTSAAEAPDTLKTLLIGFSDVLTDRESIGAIAKFLLDHRGTDHSSNHELIGQLQGLPPELSRSFRSALITGILAGILRWPETAGDFERLSAELFADPQRDIVTVATASRLRRPGIVLDPIYA